MTTTTDLPATRGVLDVDGQIAALQAGVELLARLRGLRVPLYITVHPSDGRTPTSLKALITALGHGPDDEYDDDVRLVRLCLAAGALDGPATYPTAGEDPSLPQVHGALNGVPVTLYTSIKTETVQARVPGVLAAESARAESR
ncbi:hypothetical protein AB1484_22980 [Parafrankia sp. FMc6]|uniref:hypothetical protein n=1 Tax=Parafrankia soli TaxID=2599596 RepID=UPI0034D45FBF